MDIREKCWMLFEGGVEGRLRLPYSVQWTKPMYLKLTPKPALYTLVLVMSPKCYQYTRFGSYVLY